MHDVFVDVGSGAGGEECNEPKQADAINHGKDWIKIYRCLILEKSSKIAFLVKMVNLWRLDLGSVLLSN